MAIARIPHSWRFDHSVQPASDLINLDPADAPPDPTVPDRAREE
jgi:hypothetical protein